MFSIQPDILLNMAIPLWAYFFGYVYATIAFVLVVYVEARVMKGMIEIDHLVIPDRKRLKFSFVANTISTILGLVVVYIASIENGVIQPNAQLLFIENFLAFGVLLSTTFGMWILMLDGYIKWMIYAFLLSILVEFITLLLLIRRKEVTWSVLRATVAANVVSYIVLGLLPLVLLIAMMMIGFLA